MAENTLDHTFHALADPTRRQIVEMLRDGQDATLSSLAEPFDMSLPGVMKHVKVLEDAGLISRKKLGRTVHCRFNPAPLDAAQTWLEETAQFWSARFDALAEHLEDPPESTDGDDIRKRGDGT